MTYAPPRASTPLLLTLGVLLLCGGIRWHLSGMPLERDEGEYACMAQRILVGTPPFHDVFAMKFPGIHLAYAVILKLFGQTDTGIRTALLVMNAVSCLLVHGIVRRVADSNAACWAAASFAVASISPSVLGMTANAEHFVIFFALAGTWFTARSTGTPTILAAGLCFGTAVTMKQHGVVFVLLGGTWLFIMQQKVSPRTALRSLGIYLLGVTLPLVAMGLWMWKAGVWNSFWFWCVTYARHYGIRGGAAEGWRHLINQSRPVLLQLGPLVLAASVGIWIAIRKRSVAAPLLILWLVCGFVATTPGWLFRPHYFLFLIPGISLAAGLALSRLRWNSFIALILFAPIIFSRSVLFASPASAILELYPNNPFEQLRRIGLSLQQSLKPGEKLVVLGSEPEIYFYSNHPAATPYIYMYPLLESQPYAVPMQQHLMDSMEQNPPDVIVHVRIPTSWLVQPNSTTKLLEWIPAYLEKRYQKIQEIILSQSDSNGWTIAVHRRRTALISSRPSDSLQP